MRHLASNVAGCPLWPERSDDRGWPPVAPSLLIASTIRMDMQNAHHDGGANRHFGGNHRTIGPYRLTAAPPSRLQHGIERHDERRRQEQVDEVARVGGEENARSERDQGSDADPPRACPGHPRAVPASY